jgi:hypothetical protein
MKTPTFIGRIGHLEAPEPPTIDETRDRRVQQARERTKWTEIAEPVRRGRFYVDAASDELLVTHHGALFDRTGIVRFADDRDDLRFYIDQAGDVVVLERSRAAKTYSDLVEQRTRAQARR